MKRLIKWLKNPSDKEIKSLKKILTSNNLPKDARILDIGCGYGRILTCLQKEGYSNVTGVDINKNIIETNTKNGFNCVHIDDFKKDTQTWDCVIMFHVVEHFSPDDLLDFLDDYLNTLSKNGLLIIATPLMTKIFYKDFDHIKPYLPDSFIQIFGGLSQIQYNSQYLLLISSLKYITIPYDLRLLGWYRIKQHRLLAGCFDLFFRLLYYISLSLISKKVSWIGSFKKQG